MGAQGGGACVVIGRWGAAGGGTPPQRAPLADPLPLALPKGQRPGPGQNIFLSSTSQATKQT